MADIYDYEPLFNGWQVGERLGAGGFGEVYEVFKEEFGITQHAAVKRISVPEERLSKDPKLLDRIRTEIQSMVRMKGAGNVVAIEEFAIENWKRGRGQDILIRMELLTSLDTIIEKEKLDVDEIKKIGTHICQALELCEKYNLIHRDIKPANIFRSMHGDYKLGDFGVAKAMESGQASTHTGTPGFMAPEVRFSKNKYDKRVDVYSLGITMYYLLNRNMMPFENTDDDFMTRILSGETFPDLQGIPAWLSRAVLKACSHKPEDRFGSAMEMKAALSGQEVDKPKHVVDKPKPQENADKYYKRGESFYWGRLGASIDYRLAAEWYKKAAEQGHADAQLRLGVMYSKGRGVPRDDKQAVEWFRKSAEQGHADAQYNLGLMYLREEGVALDDKQAAEWFRKSAEQGHAAGQNTLGVMYKYGRGVTQDYRQAVEWCRKSAEQGHDTGQFNLGKMYEDGNGVPKDTKQAIEWYRKASEQGHAEANEALARLL